MHLWTRREIDAPAEVVWSILTDTDRWPDWGPSVKAATLDGPAFAAGATGTLTTVIGVDVPFRITSFETGRSWSWLVAGIPATRHEVVPIDADRCSVGFGVPLLAAGYLAVCRVATGRIESMAIADRTVGSDR